jgi:RNA polymerase sigma-70 factor (ECF subfamily)
MLVKENNDLFWQLLEPLHPKAESFCRRLAANFEDGNDLYQEAVLQALRKFKALRDRTAFRAWIYRIIINTLKSRRRKYKPQQSMTDEMAETMAVSNPENEYDAKILVEYAMGVLSPDDRGIVTLYELEGWSIGEIAQIESKPEGTIKSRLFRSREKMREAILKNLPRAKKNNEESKYELPRSETGNIQEA